MITLLLESSWLHLKGCLGVFVYVYGVCVCMYVFVRVTGEAMRSECSKEISTSTLFLLCPETQECPPLSGVIIIIGMKQG